jgi:hypothetical protein
MLPGRGRLSFALRALLTLTVRRALADVGKYG